MGENKTNHLHLAWYHEEIFGIRLLFFRFLSYVFGKLFPVWIKQSPRTNVSTYFRDKWRYSLADLAMQRNSRKHEIILQWPRKTSGCILGCFCNFTSKCLVDKQQVISGNLGNFRSISPEICDRGCLHVIPIDSIDKHMHTNAMSKWTPTKTNCILRLCIVYRYTWSTVLPFKGYLPVRVGHRYNTTLLSQIWAAFNVLYLQTL